MHISRDIYFIGGFGTVAWVDVKEYEALQPDKIAIDGGEQNLKVRSYGYTCCIQHINILLFPTCMMNYSPFSFPKELNAMFSKSLKEILSIEMELDDAAFISIDSKGTDIRVRQGAQVSTIV